MLVTDILAGVAIAVGLSVIELLSRLAHPHDAVQGTVPNLPGLHDIDDWEGATTIPGLVIYRYERVSEKSGLLSVNPRNPP